MVSLTFGTQALTIEDKSPRQLESLDIEVPAIGWKEPRPATHLPGLHGLDCHCPPFGHTDVQRHFAMPQQVKLVCRLALAAEKRPGWKASIGRAARYHLQETGLQVCEEGVRG